ncbi:MAG: hypothetical protein E7620_02620 [Ruminococcaceae bacterium]|nr:hypothetical protein [Oscillospiraceae bacterium]
MKRIALLLLSALLFLLSLVGCDRIGNTQNDPTAEEDVNSKPYEFTFASNGNGTCKITGVTFAESNAAPFTLAFPEASPEGEKVTSIAYQVASIVPHWISKSDYEAKIDAKVKTLFAADEFQYRKFSTYYSYYDIKNGMTVTQAENLLMKYPALEKTALYVLLPDVSAEELLYLGDILAQVGFSYADKQAAHTETGFADDDANRVVYPANLQKMSFPEGLTYVAPEVYLNCVTLQTLTVPAGVTELEKDAITGRSSYREIELPKTLTKIEDRAIECPNVTVVRFGGTLAEWEAVAKEPYSLVMGSDARVICTDGELALK